MAQLFTQLLAAAALQTRERLTKEHGPFMPPTAFETVERCNQVLYEAGWYE